MWMVVSSRAQPPWVANICVEGRISLKYVEMQRFYYKLRKGCRQSETRWATGFIENLIRITHDQLTWRNKELHKNPQGAETPFE